MNARKCSRQGLADLRLLALGELRVTLVMLVLAVTWDVHIVDACGNGTCKLRDFCLQDEDCAQGLYCSQCPLAGDVLRRCLRDHATPVAQLDDSRPFNKYAWLTTHNSFSWFGAPLLTGVRLTLFNQENSIADQLKAGVRGLMLDTYDFLDDIWLCHSSGGACNNATAFEPLQNTLQVVHSFLQENPTEVITLILEDYVTAPNGLSKAFDAAGLLKYFFPAQSMPQNGEDWPTLRQMVANNWRLLVFTSKSAKESIEGIPYEWKYLVESQYGDGGQVEGECPSRSESAPLSDQSKSLVLLNYFSSIPILDKACVENADKEIKMLATCRAAAGNRWGNYLAVDFYKRSQGGGAFQAVDYLNGLLHCGCGNLSLCSAGSTIPAGLCDTAGGAATKPATTLLLAVVMLAAGALLD